MTAMKPTSRTTASTPPVEDRRQRKARQTREAMAAAAIDLILERGLSAVTVEAIAERADVTRRTFSRHFNGKEDAALDFTRADGDYINAALRARPADEPPFVAYRNAVGEWLAARETLGGQPYARWQALLRLTDTESALFAAYERIRVDAQDESVAIVAERLGTDPDRDLRPAVVVGAAAGVLTAALRTWARQEHEDARGLQAWVNQAYDALIEQAAGATGSEVTVANEATVDNEVTEDKGVES
ncbi:TetR/AcrR family transcriptional regulator [Streptomyces himalayensis]|uniref:TetR family transcriptional regulator n=1 Tax=Streptomyces himalayensis subsp. himalayensis TaxID=2756131 RepID=A0A7W0DMW1_9ACTN|nr:TetR/AcrR family transcriptional regulator [Streptomyces himalayensis]MBA2948012.1 TetR family transcriptional regulator [Streptomyces himalayensis subsp. himalayensis]